MKFQTANAVIQVQVFANLEGKKSINDIRKTNSIRL